MQIDIDASTILFIVAIQFIGVLLKPALKNKYTKRRIKYTKLLPFILTGVGIVSSVLVALVDGNPIGQSVVNGIAYTAFAVLGYDAVSGLFGKGLKDSDEETNNG